ncbi:hypothetical protein D0Z00_000230 [Geotrichum galactomycetum]|uniref:Uncharacterized protein n=1 Tax=Geotrichum galactomycetum TaxID=27317 RepID=A0ACB6VAI9_9ASCO|nr:hypothetical protein D0Z00_000230 [Geotrichum candidum]
MSLKYVSRLRPLALGRSRLYSSLPPTNRAFLASPVEGETVTINGWVRSVRKSKNVAFADISDGTVGEPVALVMNPDLAKSLLTGACIEATGQVKASTGKQAFEIEANAIKVLGPATKEYPLQKKFHTKEFLRTIPEYRWKTSTGATVMRYRSSAISKISNYFESQDFTQVSSPIITASDCEGGGEVFQISGGKDGAEFFGPNRPAYLSVSSQLHLEVFTGALSRVWNLAPAFRAESSDTNRHLSEFWMIEAEMAFATELDQVMTVAENMIRSAVTPLLDEANSVIARDLLATKKYEDKEQKLRDRWNMLAGSKEPWKRITYTEAVDILQGLYRENRKVFGKVRPPKWGEGLASVHEKYLAGEYFNAPVFITDYPTSQKPFYMLGNDVVDPERQTVSCFDLIVPEIGELIGGSMRESSHDKLVQYMTNRDMNPEDLQWYLKLREHGAFPHGGFGMGFERFIAFVTGQENIRDVIGFPRWAGSCVC